MPLGNKANLPGFIALGFVAASIATSVLLTPHSLLADPPVTGTASAPAPSTLPFRNPALPFVQRVDDLVGRMTLSEKADQLQMATPENKRLGIPPCDWWTEALHGLSRSGKTTVYPSAVAMAASWDPPLLGRVAAATADEARAKFDPHGARSYGLMLWAPTINMARDPRWGRTEETYGEDPYLTSRLAVQFVKGIQGDDPKYLKAVATPKHFAMHNQETDRMSGEFEISERTLREYYLPAFQACFVEAKATSTMTAFNGINGVPCAANSWLLTDLLRKEWGFEGSVVSDWSGVTRLISGHHLVKTDDEAVAKAITAGLDVICEPHSMTPNVLRAVETHLLTQEAVDQAVKRNLMLRFRLGFFDPPEMVPFAKMPADTVGSKEHTALALQAAREAIVLLKNDDAPRGYGFEKLLPLDLRRINSIAVVGPYANLMKYGAYSGTPADAAPSAVEAIRSAVGDRILVRSADYSDIEGASKIAAGSDITIAIMGLNEQMEHEGSDRTSLALSVDQNLFMDRIVHANPMTILVVVGGSPIGMTWIKEHFPAVVMLWYPGEQGTRALTETLLGQYNPAGRLPITFYPSVLDLPPLNDYEISKGRTYMYFTQPVLYPFGFGLSYTQFSYSNLRTLAPTTTSADSVVQLQVDITNTGPRDGDEIVQLYVHKPDSAVPRPIRQLESFQRVSLPKGATRTLTFKLPVSQLAYWDTPNHRFTVEPGPYEIQIGASSQDIRLRTRIDIK